MDREETRISQNNRPLLDCFDELQQKYDQIQIIRQATRANAKVRLIERVNQDLFDTIDINDRKSQSTFISLISMFFITITIIRTILINS